VRDDDVRLEANRLLLPRLAIGLAQGVGLYFVFREHLALPAPVEGGLRLMLLLAPLAVLGAFGALRRPALVGWSLAASAISFGLGAYSGFAQPRKMEGWLDPPTVLFTAVALFVLHHLIVPADAERRWRAAYERYFDEGWRDAVRLALSGLFLGVFWLLLTLGAELFHLIGLDFLKHLIRKAWFAWPVSAVVFAAGVHLTDVRAELVRGARALLLNLMSWLLPVLTVITAGFLLALPFTGLEPLTKASSAAGVMLAACAGLIVFINAAYQDGERSRPQVAVLRWATRVAGVSLVPMLGIAIYGISIRIGQHGLSPARIYSVACAVVAAGYALGYAVAAVSRGPWMRRLEATNWLTAHLVVLVIVCIFSPIVDPARISVESQLDRLRSGRISPEKFDYQFLGYRSGRWGREALDALATDRSTPRAAEIARRAAQVQRTSRRFNGPQPALWDMVQVIGSPLPASLLAQTWTVSDNPTMGCMDAPASCVAFTAELDAAPGPEVVVVVGDKGRRAVYGQRNGRWAAIGTLGGRTCAGDLDALRRGDFRIQSPSAVSAVVVNGRTLPILLNEPCPSKPAAPTR
jgi:hypothetical protein